MARNNRCHLQSRIRAFSVEPRQSSQTAPTVAKNAPVQTKTYHKKHVDEDQQQYVRYASKISNNDIDFLSTLEAENGLWTHDRVGVTGDIGFCQISPYYHPEITNDPRFKSDPYWQLDRCLELYRGGTKFYGYDRREPLKSRFELVESL